MRILQVAPLWETVPPPAYGGTEAVVSALTDGLVRAGHHVALCASGDSRTLADLRAVYPRSLRTAPEIGDGTPYDWIHAAEAIAAAGDFDIIHNHAGEPVMALAGLTPVPMLTTMHCLITPDTRIVWDRYRGYYNTISSSQRKSVPPLTRPNHAGVVHNAIDVASFPFVERKEDHLLYLSRISPEKGAHIAIEAARRSGRKLIVAGKVDRADRQYYETTVRPLIDGHQTVFVGEADAEAKRQLYSRAAALLMPLCWEEPFGLVMTEAMACGTPVIAFNRGAAPEIVVDGETGFLVEDEEAMIAAIARVDTISPARCRQHVTENFDTPVMVKNYVSMYTDILRATIGDIGIEVTQVPPMFSKTPVDTGDPLAEETVR